MNAARFQRVKEVFLNLMALEADQRERALVTECRGDDALAAEVRSLMHDSGESGFLAEPALGAAFSVAEAIARADGLVVGPYRTLAVLGAGTFGIVYRASRQDGPDVALKVLRPGRATPTLIGRFLREGSALRQLDHPGIARVLATGTTTMFGEEVPWLAMELIAGQPLDRYVRQAGVAVRGRLELVAALAEAVQHAHGLGVVHNDLKPENVLITDAGEVKVIDFGLAAFVGEEEPAGGTLGYASPERFGQHVRGGTAADVWALGAIAYELLTDRLPLDWLRGRPTAPGERVEAWPLGALRPELRGDLTTVVHYALATDPRRRCPSAAFFAADLRRFLAGEPVRSPRPRAWQRLAGWARQHRSAAVGLATTFAALTLGIVGTAAALANARQARVAEKAQREQAEASLAEATAARERTVSANLMLTSLLRAPLDDRDPDSSRIEHVYVSAAKNLTVEASAAAGLQPMIFVSLAKTLRHLGHYALAARQYEKALRAERLAGVASSELLSLRIDLGLTLGDAGEEVAAERALNEVRAELDAMPEPQVDVLLRCLLAQARIARDSTNEPALRRIVDDARELVADRPETDVTALRVRKVVADLKNLQGDNTAAVAELEGSLAHAVPAHGEDSQIVDLLSNELALACARTNQLDRADELYQRILAQLQRRLEPDHPDVLRVLHNIGSLRVRQRRYDEAIAILEPLVDIRRRRLGAAHAVTITTRINVAWAHFYRGDEFAAEVVLRRILQDIRASASADRFLDEASPIAEILGLMLSATGRDDEARACLELWHAAEACRTGRASLETLKAKESLGRLRVE
jgi:tetratricopeptide (TPR) repeat protein